MLPRISDSNYVPLSATQAPVTGLTDILTPVNLLPNSDFSRTEGFGVSQALTNVTSNINIAPGIAITLLGRGNFSGNVTMSTNSLRITGTLTTTSAVGHTIGLNYDNVVKSNKFYTAAATIIDHNNNAAGVSLYLIGSSSAVYETEGKDGQTYYPVFIRKTNNPASSVSYSPYVYYSAQETGTTINIDIEFKDMRLYEGEFKNPSITSSLDVKAGNQFMLKNGSNSITNRTLSSVFTCTLASTTNNTYSNIFYFDTSNNTGSAFRIFGHVRFVIAPHRNASANMVAGDFDISYQQYTTYGMPDAEILNEKINIIEHPNQSGTSFKEYIKVDGIQIVRDSSNNRKFTLQIKLLTSSYSNFSVLSEDDKLTAIFEYNELGAVSSLLPRIIPSHSLIYGVGING